MRRQLAVVGALACFVTPSLARATCLTRCDVRLVFEDCTSPEDGAWPAELPVGLVMVCGDARHSPDDALAAREPDAGGCVASVPATQIELRSVKSDGRTMEPMQAAFTEKGTCLGWPRLELEQPLPPGTYQVVQPTGLQLRVSDEVSAEAVKRGPPVALSCYQCWGGGPPEEPQVLPPPPLVRSRSGCEVGAAGASGAAAIGGLALLLGRRRRRVRG
ncbi:MYXO-CTERM domain-containing protein [Nannocystis exedens]|uniref:MYXO-CTERM domain-containing protein n=1 Tax=Nannocystis exedens TaxID=54 RepID=A0A1I2F1I3_9BACT|nr:hypothetical protein [Nannocystis exedens]PCC69570.1 hypothetical protein NAEX_02592 [Nannocystis exedens]SFE98516.1 MYXO-CTERM domain-containing protein [Nannocystis exedens]